MMQRNQINGVRGNQGLPQGFTMPVSVPVNAASGYSDSSGALGLAAQSPAESHGGNASPRPPSVQPGGLLDIHQNGYQGHSSPSPGTSPSPGLQGVHHLGALKRNTSSPDNQTANLVGRTALRVVIPNSSNQGIQRNEDGTSLNGIPAALNYGSNGHSFQTGDFPLGGDLNLSLQQWSQGTNLQQTNHNIPHLSISGTTPPHSTTHSLKVKSEPMSPRQPSVHHVGGAPIEGGHHSIQSAMRNHTNHLSPGHIGSTDSLSMNSPGPPPSVSPGPPPEIHIHQVQSSHSIDSSHYPGESSHVLGPLHKRLRISADSWSSS